MSPATAERLVVALFCSALCSSIANRYRVKWRHWGNKGEGQKSRVRSPGTFKIPKQTTYHLTSGLETLISINNERFPKEKVVNASLHSF